MRRVTLVSIYDAVLRRLGIDPVSDAVTHDTARAFTQHATERTKKAWEIWPWADLTLTEERAYRQVYNDTVQYRQVAEDGFPDELYYLGDQKYYKVKAGDPPIGTLPTNATYFELLDPVTQYVARDQRNKRPLGLPIGVYASNPSLNGNCPPETRVSFRPSEKGIRVYYGGNTVFIQYLLPPPEFSLVPWITGKNYMREARVFYGGDCYRSSLDNNIQLPTDPLSWVLEPVPARFATYLKAAVFADTQREIPKPKDPGEAQARIANIQLAEAEAKDAIESEIDKEYRQGYKSYYAKSYWPCVSWNYDGTLWWPQTGTCHSVPWTGSDVHLLTDAIEYGWQPPTPAPAAPTLIYRYEINSLIGPEAPSLKNLPSAPLPLDTLIKIVINVGGSPQEQSWRVDPGTALQPEPTMGEIEPADYDVITNDKKYVKVI